jgi:hypothetical protein
MRYFAIAVGFAFAITAMFALGPAKAETIISGDKCWLTTSGNSNPQWAACPKEAKVAKVAKVSAKVTKVSHRKEPNTARAEAAKPQNR